MSLPTPTTFFHWREVLSGVYSFLSTPILFWILISLIVLSVLSVVYNPALNVILTTPLLSYLGMKYGNIYVSVWKVKLRITDIEFIPSKSTIIKNIFLTLFPGANVLPPSTTTNNCVDFPESKITVGKITIKARISSLARSNTTTNLDVNNDGSGGGGPHSSSSHRNGNNSGNEFPPTKRGEDNNDGTGTTIQKELGLGGTSWFGALINHCIPRPVIVIILHNVTIHVEKVYLAPRPPPILLQHHAKKSTSSYDGGAGGDDDDNNNCNTLPLAIPLPSDNSDVEHLPTFDQDYFWEMVRDEGSYNAESLTFYIERWIDHAVTTLKKKGGG